jgi:DNA (cytosine-5)-methyltransferase 1
VQWLRNLVAAGEIPEGCVDDWSIRDVAVHELRAFSQCHFFAGIAGWSLALRLAGWPEDCPVWTGSCPCQPFSTAGRRGGFDDDRHLWPAWYALIRECRPAIVFGEQVASPDGLRWFDLVSTDLESAGYAVGAADLCAASVGAPHIRQRLYFVALADSERREGLRVHLRERRSREGVLEAVGGGEVGVMDDARGARGGWYTGEVSGAQSCVERSVRGLVDVSQFASTGLHAWSRAEWLACSDGRHRPVEPGVFPLAPRLPGHVGQVRAYGNSIVPQVAATFIEAVIDLV